MQERQSIWPMLIRFHLACATQSALTNKALGAQCRTERHSIWPFGGISRRVRACIRSLLFRGDLISLHSSQFNFSLLCSPFNCAWHWRTRPLADQQSKPIRRVWTGSNSSPNSDRQASPHRIPRQRPVQFRTECDYWRPSEIILI